MLWCKKLNGEAEEAELCVHGPGHKGDCHVCVHYSVCDIFVRVLAACIRHSDTNYTVFPPPGSDMNQIHGDAHDDSIFKAWEDGLTAACKAPATPEWVDSRQRLIIHQGSAA